MTENKNSKSCSMSEPCRCFNEGERRKTRREPRTKKLLLNRLKRIEGQLHGLVRMLEEDAYCNDILIQSAAVSAAIRAFNKELLDEHIRGCVAGDIKNGRDEIFDELSETLRMLIR